MISEALFLIEQVRSRRTEVYDFGTAISVFLQPGTFEAVESVRNSLSCISWRTLDEQRMDVLTSPPHTTHLF
jgi:hypothetical protein